MLGALGMSSRQNTNICDNGYNSIDFKITLSADDLCSSLNLSVVALVRVINTCGDVSGYLIINLN